MTDTEVAVFGVKDRRCMRCKFRGTNDDFTITAEWPFLHHICDDGARSKTRPVHRRPWPLGPLLEATGHTNDCRWAAEFGMNGTELAIVRDEGLTDAQADHFAVAAGLSPYNVWHNYGGTDQ